MAECGIFTASFGIVHFRAQSPEYTGSIVVEQGLSCSVVCGILVPRSRIEPACSALQGGFLNIGSLRKPSHPCSLGRRQHFGPLRPSHVLLSRSPSLSSLATKGHPWWIRFLVWGGLYLSQGDTEHLCLLFSSDVLSWPKGFSGSLSYAEVSGRVHTLGPQL